MALAAHRLLQQQLTKGCSGGEQDPSKGGVLSTETSAEGKKQLSTRSAYLGLRVQVRRVSRDAELHCPRFYGNYSYRYPSQPGDTGDKSQFLLLHNGIERLKRDKEGKQTAEEAFWTC